MDCYCIVLSTNQLMPPPPKLQRFHTSKEIKKIKRHNNLGSLAYSYTGPKWKIKVKLCASLDKITHPPFLLRRNGVLLHYPFLDLLPPSAVSFRVRHRVKALLLSPPPDREGPSAIWPSLRAGPPTRSLGKKECQWRLYVLWWRFLGLDHDLRRSGLWLLDHDRHQRDAGTGPRASGRRREPSHKSFR